MMNISDLAPQTQSTSDSMFRIVVPANDPTAPNALSIELGGIRWTPTEYAPVPSSDEAPEYTCISYSWGSGKTANPFDNNQSVSGRAIPALETTIRALRPTAIWLDALCVPSEGPARAACLRSMGKIYGSASQVVAVLSSSCLPALEQINGTSRLDPANLAVLENDEWVTRAWTYQELANSRNTLFVAEGGGISVRAEQFLNSLGHALTVYNKSQALDPFRMRAEYPRLDSLQDVLADWMLGEPSAHQVMSAMDSRFSVQKDDHFNAMIGAITTAAPDDLGAVELHPAEYFMRVCEAKDDYSFIYCIARRSELPGRRWRPLAGPMAAILRWHSWGKQSGSLYPTHLQLNNMCPLSAGSLAVPAKEFIEEWLRYSSAAHSASDIPYLVLQNLKQAGFSGCGEYLALEGGYFFPQSVSASGDNIVLVGTDVRWVHGAPGLLVSREDDDLYSYRGVGIFVGPVPQGGNSINIG